METILFIGFWGYLAVFVLSFIESLPGIGIFFPAQTLVVLAGFLSRLGLMDITTVVVLSGLGAVSGGLTGYYIGRVYADPWLEKYGERFWFKKEYYKATKNMIREHTRKTLLFGKFNSVTRSFVPFLAGCTKIKLGKYLLYDIISSFGWAVAFVMIGYFFGESYELVSSHAGKYIAISVAACALLAYGYFKINKKKHIFGKKHLYILIVGIAAISSYLLLMQDIHANSTTSVDTVIYQSVPRIWNPWLTEFMIVMTTAANTIVFLTMSFLLLCILLFQKKIWHAALLTFSLFLGLSIELLTKMIMHRPRPLGSLVATTNYSFPSGHATMALILFSLAFYAYKNGLKPLYKWLAGLFCCLLILLVGVSRVYLQAHWLTDVIGGFCLGIFVLSFTLLIFKVIPERAITQIFYKLKKGRWSDDN